MNIQALNIEVSNRIVAYCSYKNTSLYRCKS